MVANRFTIRKGSLIMNFETFGRLASAALLTGLMMGSLSAVAAEPNEKLTGLPLHEGLSFQQEVDSAVCGKSASMNLYNAPMTSSHEEYVAWYKRQLKDSTTFTKCGAIGPRKCSTARTALKASLSPAFPMAKEYPPSLI
jgi:hypothetical protein